jgi:hypothetical protein
MDQETQDIFYPIIYPIAWLYILVDLGRGVVQRQAEVKVEIDQPDKQEGSP